jgi:hypothetical protein
MILFLLLPIILIIAFLRLMGYVRRRWLWKDSGFVRPSRWAIPRRTAVISAVAFGLLLAAGLGVDWLVSLDEYFPWRMLWTAVSWATAITFIGIGRHLGLVRYVWLGVAGGLAATPLLFIKLPFELTMLLACLIWGLILIVSGVVVMRSGFKKASVEENRE